MSKSSENEEWPKFSRVKYEVEGDVASEIAAYISEVGVPRGLIGSEYACLSVDRLVAKSDGWNLIQFGTSGLFGNMFVENPCGRVVQIVGDDLSDRNIANSNLESFSSCVRLVISRFPFYGIESIDEAEEVARQLACELLAIDPLVGSHNGFWETFLSDLTIGDYATEDVLS